MFKVDGRLNASSIEEGTEHAYHRTAVHLLKLFHEVGSMVQAKIING
jgi:hypothetical protein